MMTAVALSMGFAACSPDEYSLGEKNYSVEDLVVNNAYTVTIDGNYVHLKSLVPGCTPLWITPNGRSQNSEMTLSLPFAGDYEVTFGVETKGGVVYGEPYQFNIGQNAFEMLSDKIWSDLAGGVGKSRKWYPIEKDYGIGRCTGPMMYMSPDDVMNNQTNVTDLMFGSENWTPNWDPGIQDWLIPANDPYFQSYMEFGLDAQKGCTAHVVRVSADGTEDMNGKFNLNVSDPKRPVISFSDCYSLHNKGFDDVCANYTQDIKIIECTPYLLQIATMRTNSEGPWWLVWNFISEEAKNDPSIIPTEDAGLLTQTPVTLPEFTDLETKLFTTEINGVQYVGGEMKFLINDEAPYDWMWWNGASAAWQSVIEGNYGTNWAPAAGAEIGDFELTIAKASDGTYTWDDGANSGKMTIDKNMLKFTDNDGAPAVVKILTAANDTRTVVVEGSEFTILNIEAANALQIGVPASKDESGAVNSYLVANLLYKPVATSSGPIEVKFDASQLNPYFETNANAHQFRFDLYNPWASSGNIVDPTKIKLKKNQKLVIKFKVSGIQWNEGVTTTKLAVSDNIIVNKWGADVFADATAIDVATNASEYTVELLNNTGATANFEGMSCVSVCMLVDKDKAAGPLDADGNYDASQLQVEVVSIAIHDVK